MINLNYETILIVWILQIDLKQLEEEIEGKLWIERKIMKKKPIDHWLAVS